MEKFNDILLVVQFLIILLAGLGIYYFWWRQKDKNTAVSLWILGTFIWIFISLIFFDYVHINDSIPKLLWWLRFAFITSIMWLICSIWIWYNENQSDDIDTKDELETLHLMFNELKKLNGYVGWNTKQAIGNQLKSLREENQTQQNDIKQILVEFTDNMAENNSQALIEALEWVMRDFNTKINEQFGDNFKQLNEWVGRMLDWQKNYKTQIESHLEMIEKSEKNIEKSADMLGVVVKNSEDFESIAASLGEEIKILAANMTTLEQGVDKFESVATSMEILSSSMMWSINELSNNFVSSAEDITETNKEQIEFMKETIEEQNNSLSKNIKDMTESYSDIIKNIKDNQQKILTNSMNQIEEFNKDTLEKVSNQIVQFDKELADELTKAIDSLWTWLTSLSASLANDYRNLAESIKKASKEFIKK